MFPARRDRTALTAAALVLAGLLAGCAGPKPPPPPPPPPPVSLSPKLIEQAGAYRAFVARGSAISPTFMDGAAVAQSLQTGAGYEPKQMLHGAIAYGAVVALQDPSFVAGVRTYAADPVQRQQTTYAILKDPAYALGFAGAGSAAARVIAALGDDGRALHEQGRLVRQASYDMQRMPWSKAEVPNRDLRLTQVKSISATPGLGDAAETLRMQQAASGMAAGGTAPAPATPPYSPLVGRALAVAALAALGEAGDDKVNLVLPLMAEPNIGDCFALSKLNTFQCLAVAKPHYEDVFCLGQHMLMDTGKCVVRAAGEPAPLDIRTQPLAIAESAPAKASAKSSKTR